MLMKTSPRNEASSFLPQ